MEYTGIRNVFRYLLLEIELVSRNTAKGDVIKLYEKEKLRIRKLLESAPCGVSLTSDGYVCLTVHFIDKDWNLQKYILNFSYVPPPHMGFTLSKKLYGFISDWGLAEKVFSVTLDNVSANGVSIDILR